MIKQTLRKPIIKWNKNLKLSSKIFRHSAGGGKFVLHLLTAEPAFDYLDQQFPSVELGHFQSLILLSTVINNKIIKLQTDWSGINNIKFLCSQTQIVNTAGQFLEIPSNRCLHITCLASASRDKNAHTCAPTPTHCQQHEGYRNHWQ